MSRLRITHINTHNVAGGAAKVAERLALAQRAAGHDARILARHVSEGLDGSSAFDPRPDPMLERLCRQTGQLYYHFQGSHTLLDHPLVAGADLLHLHNLHGDYFNPFSLVQLSLARPVLWTLHDMQALTGRCAHSFECDGWAEDCRKCPHLETYPTTGVDSAASLLRDKALLAEVAPVFLAVPSRWLQLKVERSILRTLPCRHIPNFCDTAVFSPRAKLEARRRFGLPENARLVGASAHGGPLSNQWKGGDASCQAIQSLLERDPDIRFVNIGASGPATHPWLINIPRQDQESSLAEALSALDLFLYTPVADNCPLVVLEALSCGLPVACFGVGGVPELVRHQVDGWVSPPGDVSDLVQGAWALLEDDGRRKACAQASRRGAVERFGVDQALRAYAALASEARDAHLRAARRPVRLALDRFPPVVKSGAFLLALARLEQDRLVQGLGRWPRERVDASALDMGPLCAFAEACLRAGQPARAWPVLAHALLRNPFEPRAAKGFFRAAEALGARLDFGLCQQSPGSFANGLRLLELVTQWTGGVAPSQEAASGVPVALSVLSAAASVARIEGELEGAQSAAGGRAVELLALCRDESLLPLNRITRKAEVSLLREARFFSRRPDWPTLAHFLLWKARGEAIAFRPAPLARGFAGERDTDTALAEAGVDLGQGGAMLARYRVQSASALRRRGGWMAAEVALP